MTERREEPRSRYWEAPSRAGAAHVIERWSFSADRTPDPPAVRVLPAGRPSLLFSAAPEGGAWQGWVQGSTTRASVVRSDGPRIQIEVHLAPDVARRLLGQDLSVLCDHRRPLEDAWGDGASRLLDALAGARSWGERRSSIQRVLVRAAPAESASGALVRRTLEALTADAGRTSMRRLYASLGVSERRVERAFRARLGLSPKRYARIVRLRAAREDIRRGAPLARVAAARGYSDQAHLSREFRSLAGLPPSAFGPPPALDPAR